MDEQITNRLNGLESLESLYSGVPVRRYKKKQTIIREGDHVSYFFYIKDGYVKVYTLTDDGEEKILLILGAHDTFPLLKNPDQPVQTSPYFYEALEDAELYAVDQTELLDKVKSDRQASWELLSYVSAFSSTLTNRLMQLENKTAEDKLEKLLPYLAAVCGQPDKDGGYRLKLKLTHQEIANLIGLARETVSVELKKMESQGKVKYQDGYLVIPESAQATGQ